MNRAQNRTQPTVVFLHGLNTFGDDLLHLGPVKLGRMDMHVKREFEKLGCHFISIDGVGFGSPDDQASFAAMKLAEQKDLRSESDIYLLGNSMGGLVARALASLLKNRTESNPKKLKVAKLLAWGTPHHGALAADLALAFSTSNPRLVNSISKLGYDLKKNESTYRHYSTESLKKFNERYPLNSTTAESTFLCAVSARSSSPYFWGLYGLLHGIPIKEFSRRLFDENVDPQPSDGFISLKSQTWGDTHGPYALDHFGQTGFHQILPKTAQRVKARKEFEKLCHDMYRVMTSEI